jgi:hypothetical protein
MECKGAQPEPEKIAVSAAYAREHFKFRGQVPHFYTASAVAAATAEAV